MNQAENIYNTDPSDIFSQVSAAVGVSVAVLKEVWPVHSFNDTVLAPDMLDFMVAEDAWVAQQDRRTAMTKEDLANLIESVSFGRGTRKLRIGKGRCILLNFLRTENESAATLFTSILNFFQPPPPIFSTSARSKMLQRDRFNDDPFSSPLPETPPSTAVKWANRVARPSRFSGLRLTPLRIGILLFFIGGFILIRGWVFKATSRTVSCGFASKYRC